MTMQSQKSQAYLVTLWTYGVEPTFSDPARAALFCRILAGLRLRLGFLLHAYVVLPDRVRLIVAGHGGDPRWARITVQRLKSRYAREVNHRLGRLGLVWQDADQTFPLRGEEDVRRKADFLHHNPVLAGLVRDPGDWKWSSYRAFTGEGRTPLAVDPVTPASTRPAVPPSWPT